MARQAHDEQRIEGQPKEDDHNGGNQGLGAAGHLVSLTVGRREGIRARMEAAPQFWKSRRAVGFWLLAMAFVILGMITIGGLTRLTGSGLSITEWQPIMGAIPPLNEREWADAFAKYQRIPQYVLENRGMSLEAFKGIF